MPSIQHWVVLLTCVHAFHFGNYRPQHTRINPKSFPTLETLIDPEHLTQELQERYTQLIKADHFILDLSKHGLKRKTNAYAMLEIKKYHQLVHAFLQDPSHPMPAMHTILSKAYHIFLYTGPSHALKSNLVPSLLHDAFYLHPLYSLHTQIQSTCAVPNILTLPLLRLKQEWDAARPMVLQYHQDQIGLHMDQQQRMSWEISHIGMHVLEQCQIARYTIPKTQTPFPTAFPSFTQLKRQWSIQGTLVQQCQAKIYYRTWMKMHFRQRGQVHALQQTPSSPILLPYLEIQQQIQKNAFGSIHAFLDVVQQGVDLGLELQRELDQGLPLSVTDSGMLDDVFYMGELEQTRQHVARIEAETRQRLHELPTTLRRRLYAWKRKLMDVGTLTCTHPDRAQDYMAAHFYYSVRVLQATHALKDTFDLYSIQ